MKKTLSTQEVKNMDIEFVLENVLHIVKAIETINERLDENTKKVIESQLVVDNFNKTTFSTKENII